jgi:ribonuclease HI
LLLKEWLLVGAEIIERDGEAGTVVYLDARFDSSREGFHGTVPILDMVIGKVLHVVTLTRIETGSAWKMEDAAVRQALEDLEEAGIHIVEAVHDDKCSVDGILADYGIWSSKDLWHKCKNLCSKFRDELVKVRREAIASPGEARAACDLKTLTVDKLKEFLKASNLEVKGGKDALIARVWLFLKKEEEEVEEDSRLLRYPELSKHGLTDRLKIHIYTCCKSRALAKDDNVTFLRQDIH